MLFRIKTFDQFCWWLNISYLFSVLVCKEYILEKKSSNKKKMEKLSEKWSNTWEKKFIKREKGRPWGGAGGDAAVSEKKRGWVEGPFGVPGECTRENESVREFRCVLPLVLAVCKMEDTRGKGWEGLRGEEGREGYSVSECSQSSFPLLTASWTSLSLREFSTTWKISAPKKKVKNVFL